MFDNIVFIGGIHGVGKTTICQNICDKFDVEHLSASELIRWTDINDDKMQKQVKNVSATQDRLINSLMHRIEKDKIYLLDGHYCLLSSENKIVNVPYDTFIKIKPISLNLITADISEIKIRLESRDNKLYDYELLNEMQTSELNYAKILSDKLGISLNIGTQNDFSSILISIQNHLTK